MGYSYNLQLLEENCGRQICLLAVIKCNRAMRLPFTHYTEAHCGCWPLAEYMLHASATFANKLATCNLKLEDLCEKPQRLKTDLCDIPLLEEWCWDPFHQDPLA